MGCVGVGSAAGKTERDGSNMEYPYPYYLNWMTSPEKLDPAVQEEMNCQEDPVEQEWQQKTERNLAKKVWRAGPLLCMQTISGWFLEKQ